MSNPQALQGRYVGQAYICADWELRAARRCLTEDLHRAADTPLEKLQRVEIVKAFIEKRKDRAHDRSKVEPLTSGIDVWVLARGNDHRGGTWHDGEHDVIWLLACGLHRSGQPDDFFPYCKQLDQEDRLLPAGPDYTALFIDRDERFVRALMIEAPLILHDARQEPGEHRRLLGGDMVACISVEVDHDIDGEALYIAFKVDTVDFSRVPVVLAAFHPVEADWDQTAALPSRPAEPDEIVFTCTREISVAQET